MTEQGTPILAEVYRQHRRALFGLAQSVIGCRHLAEDAVQEAFARLCQSRALGRDPVAYVFASVRNAAISQLRRRNTQDRTHQSLFNGHSGGVNTDDPSQSLADRNGLDELAAAVDRLDGDDKQVIVLKVYANLTFDQIGKILELPLKTVASRYRRILQRLAIELRGRV